MYPISRLDNYNFNLWQIAEDYLALSTKTYRVIAVENGEYDFKLARYDLFCVSTVLKVISYITVVLPLAALCIRTVYRYLYPLNSKMLHWYQNPSNDIPTFKHDYLQLVQGKPLLLRELMQKEITFFDQGKALAEIDSYLVNGQTLLEHLPQLVTISYAALMATSTDIEFSKKVYKKIAAFYRTQTDSKLLGRYVGHLASLSREPSPDTIPGAYFLDNEYSQIENADLASLWYLMKQLRKKVKLATKGEKIQRLAAHAGVDDHDRALKYLGLTWMHGTKASVIKSACESSDGNLLPNGELNKKSITAFTGENEVGSITGINRHSISGVDLYNADESIGYAKKFVFDLQEERKYYAQFFSMGKTCYDDGEFSRIVVSMKRIAKYAPDVFLNDKERIKAKLQGIYTYIQDDIFKNKPDEIFCWHDHCYSSQFYGFLIALERIEQLLNTAPEEPLTESQKRDLQEAIPIVVGTTEHFGIPGKLRTVDTNPEMAYPGSMKFGRDIRVIFTEDEYLEAVAQTLREKGLGEQIKLESMSVLRNAQKLDRCLAHYFYDVFSVKKWKAQLAL